MYVCVYVVCVYVCVLTLMSWICPTHKCHSRQDQNRVSKTQDKTKT